MIYVQIIEWIRMADGTIKVRCPECHGMVPLSAHDIDEDGYVDPPVEHDCGFHDCIRLEDWAERERVTA